MPYSKENVVDRGLKIWSAEAEAEFKAEVDIIAVQGLKSDSYWTWVKTTPAPPNTESRKLEGRVRKLMGRVTRSQNSQAKGSSEDPPHCMWIRDLLVRQFQHARIATYSYESNWMDPKINLSLFDYAEQFLNILKQDRERKNARHRPLVLIGHSLGGILIQQALVTAVHQQQFHDLRLSVTGIIFLGAPFQGSNAAKYGVWLAKFCGRDQRLFQMLQKDSPNLQALARNFSGSYKDLDIVCYYERKPVDFNIIHPIIVTSQSGSVPEKPRIFLDTDHSGLNKFSGEDDQNYQLVLPELQRMVDIGASIVADRTEPKTVLSGLRIADNAGFDSYLQENKGRCHKDTRVDLLRQIDRWATDHSSECVYWLYGMAGTGKSTIARTIARKYDKKGDLGASYFFQTGEDGYHNARSFVGTIAKHLVEKIPPLAAHVQKAIDADSMISGKPFKTQFESLILKPLSKIGRDLQNSSKKVWLVVIDALDECDPGEDIMTLIRLLPQVPRETSISLKFFLTSKPEPPIRLCFNKMSGKYKELALHHLPDTEKDISKFLEDELANIRHEYNNSIGSNKGLPADWPGQAQVQSLVRMTMPLFICAATVCRFIHEEEMDDPHETLQTVLQYQTKSLASKLGATYLPVLDRLLVGASKSEERQRIERFQHTVGSIIILFSPLSATSLANLLRDTEDTVLRRTRRLHSVLDIPSRSDHPIRLFHQSFRDFLLDSGNREINRLWVDEKQAHHKIVTRCIELLSKCLKSDICRLETPGVLVTDVASIQIDQCLPPEVKYACVYWIPHLRATLQASGVQVCDNDQIHQIHQFLQTHFLHWLEVLCWIGKFSEVILGLNSLLEVVHAVRSPNLHAFVYDAKRFAWSNRSAIEHTPLQIYCSALLFAPKNSIIRKNFEKCIPTWIQSLPRVRGNWSAELQSLQENSTVSSVAFSPDGEHIVSGSGDHMVRIWDAVTGASLHTLEGHSHAVCSVAFSPDGKNIVSGSEDQTVRLWDVVTGTEVQTLGRHSGRVFSVAFAPDGKQIVSGSEDQTVRLWDVVTGTEVQTLGRNSGRVYSVAFAPDGKQIVSGSLDPTLQLWDAVTGASLHTLEGHSHAVYSVAFAPDGKQVVSGSLDRTVRLWDVVTGASLHTLEGHSRLVTSVAFSPDGKNIVSGSEDQTVRLWNVMTGTEVQTLGRHSGKVYSVAFSPNSEVKQVVSSSMDLTVRLWDVKKGAALHKLEGHSSGVTSMAFSPDGKHVVSGSSDRTVRLWNTATGASVQTFEGHSRTVNSVAFSPDGKNVVSGSADWTVRLWNMKTGEALYTLPGHSDEVISVAFSPDSEVRQVVSGSFDRTVRLWDVVTGVLLHTLEGHSNIVTSVAFSPDGKHVVSGSGDQMLRLWDAMTGAELFTLKGHSNIVTSVTFSPDSKYVVSGSFDRTVRLWDAMTGESLHKLEGHSSMVSSVAFSPDCKQIISVSFDRTVRFWDVVTGASLQTLEGHSGTFSADGKPCTLTVSDEWVRQADENILWLPNDFRANVTAINNRMIALGCYSGVVFFLQIASDQKLLLG